MGCPTWARIPMRRSLPGLRVLAESQNDTGSRDACDPMGCEERLFHRRLLPDQTLLANSPRRKNSVLERPYGLGELAVEVELDGVEELSGAEDFVALCELGHPLNEAEGV